MSSALPDLNATWLNRLRWFAIVGQVCTVAVTSLLTPVQLPLSSLAAVLAFEVAFAIGAEFAARRGLASTRPALLGLMTGDVLVLTALLFFAGGPENPFNFLYLVHVTLALVVVGERGAWALLVLSALLFGGLFFWHTPLQLHHGASHSAMGLHMQGMWVGFVVAGVSIVAFLSRLTQAVRARDADLRDARERAQSAEKLAALATLAAGAAHELSTPLSTIALVSKELEIAARQAGDEASSMLTDARLIRAEIDRCKSILEQLSVDAGHASGTPAESASVEELLSGCRELGDARVRLSLPADVASAPVSIHKRPLQLAVSAVVSNALAAGDGDVEVVAAISSSSLILEIRDMGIGMEADVLKRALDPFYTTRETGRGMGLGLYLARSVAEALGGTLQLASVPGQGTTAVFDLPIV